MTQDLIQDILNLVDRHKGILSRMKKDGIEVNSIWRGSNGREHFVRWSLANGYSRELELDRKRSSGPYSPDNCQWITGKENRTKDYRIHEVNGKLYTLKEIHEAGLSVVSYGTLKLRMWNGWPIDKARNMISNHGNKWYND